MTAGARAFAISMGAFAGVLVGQSNTDWGFGPIALFLVALFCTVALIGYVSSHLRWEKKRGERD